MLDQPEAGFSVLSVDYSEHAATRFKGGVLGWIDSTGGSSDWTRAVSKIVFSLEETGEVSPVVADPEGIFLVRLMALKPGMQKSFAAVRNTLEREEQDRLRIQIEKEFEASLRDRYPVNSK